MVLLNTYNLHFISFYISFHVRKFTESSNISVLNIILKVSAVSCTWKWNDGIKIEIYENDMNDMIWCDWFNLIWIDLIWIDLIWIDLVWIDLLTLIYGALSSLTKRELIRFTPKPPGFVWQTTRKVGVCWEG